MTAHEKHRRCAGGFTLVEVVLALGVCAFVLSAILGLLSVAVGSGKHSSDDTVLSAVVNDLMSDLRREDFSVVAAAAGSPVTIYFDGSGKRLRDAAGGDLGRGGALEAGALYQCTQEIQGDPATADPDGTVNLVKITFKMEWPAQAATPPNSKTIHAFLAKY